VTAAQRDIVFGVSGGIAAFKSLDIIARLRERGFGVPVIMTREAQEFVRPLSFQTMSGEGVYTDMFGAPQSWGTYHISLAERARLVIVCPATANMIAKIACGICDDLLTCVVCATSAPVLIAPAMNAGMYANKITHENIQKLKKLGYHFVGPKKGRLACGSIGMGCLADVDVVVREVEKLAR
jgi:phosphopantothenoylcysteine decarboxylase / phosphopantothenate---cysteine ligase